jgi:hypothetical protein
MQFTARATDEWSAVPPTRPGMYEQQWQSKATDTTAETKVARPIGSVGGEGQARGGRVRLIICNWRKRHDEIRQTKTRADPKQGNWIKQRTNPHDGE